MPNFTSLTSSLQILSLKRSKPPHFFHIRAIYQPVLWLMIFFGFTQPASAQAPPISWQKTLGGTTGEYATGVTATSDGGYIIAGNTFSNDGDVTGNHGQDDIWVVKLDGSGAKIWQKTLGGSSGELAAGIIATADGGYIVSGSTDPVEGHVTGLFGVYDYYAAKLDGSGNLIWQRTMGGSKDDHARAMTATSDGGAVIVGLTNSNDGDVTGNHGDRDYWVVKLGNPCVSVQSGDWSNPATWLCGHEPTVKDLVIISPGHVINVSTSSAQAQQSRNNGTLRYTVTGTKVFVKGD